VKALIPILIGLLAVGCVITEAIAPGLRDYKLTPEELKFVGTYTRPELNPKPSFFKGFASGIPRSFTLQKNSRAKGLEHWFHLWAPPPVPRWKLVDGEIRTTKPGAIWVFIVNPDGSLTTSVTWLYGEGKVRRDVTYRRD
jgi:hypothetical protein